MNRRETNLPCTWQHSLAALLAAFALSCGAGAVIEPRDMPVAEHEAAAAKEDRLAAAHAAQYDPDASRSQDICRSGGDIGPICWTRTTNPTAEHRRDAEHHARMAAAHREASEALRRAEAAACVGVAPEDRDVSPFRHREDIASASPLPRPDTSQGAPAVRGAVLVFRPVPGLSAARLQRVIDCHLARNVSLGPSAMPEMSYCPLAVAGAAATVSATGDQLVVAVVSDDPVTAQEILRRAQLLGAPAR